MTIKRLTGKGKRKITLKPKNSEEAAKQLNAIHRAIHKINCQDNDTINEIEKTYLEAKKVQRSKFKSFKLFSLDASDLQVLDDIELNKVTTQAKTHILTETLNKHQTDFRKTHQSLKHIEQMIKDAVSHHDTVLLNDAKILLENIPNIKKDIIAKREGLLTSVNAILRLEINDD